VEVDMVAFKDAKESALRRDGAFNDQAAAITDPLFRTHPFFDPRDRVQARYEMLRRHQAEGLSVSAAAAAFGVSRQTFYQAREALATAGLSGLVPDAQVRRMVTSSRPKSLLSFANSKAPIPD
jgi:hypothetical protein